MYSWEIGSFLCICLLGNLNIAAGDNVKKTPDYERKSLERLCNAGKGSLGPLGINKSSSFELYSSNSTGFYSFKNCSLTIKANNNEGYVLSVYSTETRNNTASIAIAGKEFKFSNETLSKPWTAESKSDMIINFYSNNTAVKFNMTITKLYLNNCQNPDMFKCTKDTCIWKGWTCDGHVNCINGLDEAKGKEGGCGGAGTISGSGISAIILTAVIYISSKSL